MKKTQTFHAVYPEGFEVSYHWEGKHYPATQTEPAEYPELIITSFRSAGSDVEIENIPDEVYTWVENNHND